MTLELPILRLGVAGFTAEQQDRAAAAVHAAPVGIASWIVVPFTQADAWWVSGARTVVMPDGTLRVGSGLPTGRPVQLDPAQTDRPIALALPLPQGAGFEAAMAFDLDKRAQTSAVLGRFTAWLRPLIAQFSLASSIIDHYGALGGGAFHVMRGGTLLAVVDMRGDVGVLPTAEPTDFEDALWRRVESAAIPEQFARLSMSQLMWSFAMRTRRDVLPQHYRTGLLYFRRPPRLPQQMLSDAHLLLLRELASGCGTLQELQARTGLPEAHVARDLAALYLVGAITSNPKRAAEGATRRLEVPDSVPSGPSFGLLDSRHGPDAVRPRVAHDLTAPAPLRPD